MDKIKIKTEKNIFSIIQSLRREKKMRRMFVCF